MGIGRQTRTAEDKQLDEADTAITAIPQSMLTDPVQCPSDNENQREFLEPVEQH